MQDQVVWIFSNIAGESINFRNMILAKTDIIDTIYRICSSDNQKNGGMRKSILVNMIWCTCNLVR